MIEQKETITYEDLKYIDWQQGNSLIAAKTGLHFRIIQKAREQFSPETVGSRFGGNTTGRKPSEAYRKIRRLDWRNMKASEIAKKVGCPQSVVYRYMEKHNVDPGGWIQIPASVAVARILELNIEPYGDESHAHVMRKDQDGNLYIKGSKNWNELVVKRLDWLLLQCSILGVSEGFSLHEIGCFIGVTRERVRQIQENALKHIRRKAKNMVDLAEEVGIADGHIFNAARR